MFDLDPRAIVEGMGDLADAFVNSVAYRIRLRPKLFVDPITGYPKSNLYALIFAFVPTTYTHYDSRSPALVLRRLPLPFRFYVVSFIIRLPPSTCCSRVGNASRRHPLLPCAWLPVLAGTHWRTNVPCTATTRPYCHARIVLPRKRHPRSKLNLRD